MEWNELNERKRNKKQKLWCDLLVQFLFWQCPVDEDLYGETWWTWALRPDKATHWPRSGAAILQPWVVEPKFYLCTSATLGCAHSIRISTAYDLHNEEKVECTCCFSLLRTKMQKTKKQQNYCIIHALTQTLLLLLLLFFCVVEIRLVSFHTYIFIFAKMK